MTGGAKIEVGTMTDVPEPEREEEEEEVVVVVVLDHGIENMIDAMTETSEIEIGHGPILGITIPETSFRAKSLPTGTDATKSCLPTQLAQSSNTLGGLLHRRKVSQPTHCLMATTVSRSQTGPHQEWVELHHRHCSPILIILQRSTRIAIWIRLWPNALDLALHRQVCSSAKPTSTP